MKPALIITTILLWIAVSLSNANKVEASTFSTAPDTRIHMLSEVVVTARLNESAKVLEASRANHISKDMYVAVLE